MTTRLTRAERLGGRLTPQERRHIRKMADTIRMPHNSMRHLIPRLLADLERAEAAILDVPEWQEGGDLGYCHFCDGDDPKHEDGCLRAALEKERAG